MTAEEAQTAVTEASGEVSGGLIVFTLEDGREARGRPLKNWDSR